MDWKTLLAYISGSVDEELLLRIEYLVAENRILRDQINGRLQLSDSERQTLAEIGTKLGKKVQERLGGTGDDEIISNSDHPAGASDRRTKAGVSHGVGLRTQY